MSADQGRAGGIEPESSMTAQFVDEPERVRAAREALHRDIAIGTAWTRVIDTEPPSLSAEVSLFLTVLAEHGWTVTRVH